MFNNILRIRVEEAFPVHVKGRPRLLGFDDAYEDILQVVQTVICSRLRTWYAEW